MSVDRNVLAYDDYLCGIAERLSRGETVRGSEVWATIAEIRATVNQPVYPPTTEEVMPTVPERANRTTVSGVSVASGADVGALASAPSTPEQCPATFDVGTRCEKPCGHERQGAHSAYDGRMAWMDTQVGKMSWVNPASPAPSTEPDHREKELRVIADAAVEIIRECRETLGLADGETLTDAVRKIANRECCPTCGGKGAIPEPGEPCDICPSCGGAGSSPLAAPDLSEFDELLETFASFVRDGASVAYTRPAESALRSWVSDHLQPQRDATTEHVCDGACVMFGCSELPPHKKPKSTAPSND